MNCVYCDAPAKVAGGGRYTVGHTLDLYEGYQVTNAIRCVSLTSHKEVTL